MINFFLKKQEPVAIDISDFSIELLQINKSRKVLAFNRIILEPGIVRNGEILNEDRLKLKIKELISSTRPRPLDLKENLKILLSIPDSKTFSFLLETKKGLFQKQLEEKLMERIKNIVPLEPGKFYYDFMFLDSDYGNSQMLLCAVVPKNIIDKYIKIFKDLKLGLILADLESSSLGRALILNGNSVLIDIGIRTTNVSFFDADKNFRSSVTIPIGGNDFTLAVAEKLNVSYADAEKFKREVGLKDKKTNKISGALDIVFGELTKKIEESIDYFEKRYGTEIIEIILAGGSSLVPFLQDSLSKITKIAIKTPDPFDKLANKSIFKTMRGSIFFANVVGLSLRGTGDISKGINFLKKIKK
ncbi:MAG: pilus assembly protein PilM [Patescibacteria group bacterium]